LCVAASRRRRRRPDDEDERAMSSGALVVCAETWKLPREEEEEREMLECRALLVTMRQCGKRIEVGGLNDPLVVFRDIIVGWSGWALWRWADASMASFVVDSVKSLVALNDPDILPFFPSTTTACPTMDCRV
jgi:hypothetical protein